VAWLLILFVVVPVVELWVMVQVAGVIGALPTVLAVVATSLAGLWLMKVEGLGVLRRMQRQLDAGELPADEVVDGVLILAGGLLMFLPGFVSGLLGLALLLPPVRALVRPVVLARARRRLDRGGAGFTVFSTRGPTTGGMGSMAGGAVYEADSHLQPGPERPDTGPGGRGSPQDRRELGA
jgi:UPF0716 protein FxsA